MTREEAEAGVEKYRERYTDIGIWENKVYPGIMELLLTCSRMAAASHATAKPEVFALRIAKRFGFNPYLEDITGCSWMVKPIRKL